MDPDNELKADPFHLDPDYELKTDPFYLDPDNDLKADLFLLLVKMFIFEIHILYIHDFKKRWTDWHYNKMCVRSIFDIKSKRQITIIDWFYRRV